MLQRALRFEQGDPLNAAKPSEPVGVVQTLTAVFDIVLQEN